MINQLYLQFGAIFENVQYIEWNLALLVCNSIEDEDTDIHELFEEMQEMTLGSIIQYVRELDIFDEDELNDLEYILNKRNYLAHHFFKQNDIVKHQNNEIFMKNKINELKNIYTEFVDFNAYLTGMLQ